MKDQHSNGFSMEEQMLRAMSMSIYGKHIESRCRVLSAAQKSGLEAAGMQNMMNGRSVEKSLNEEAAVKSLDTHHPIDPE